MQNPFESLSTRSGAPIEATHIDDYLDRLCSPLIDKISYERRLAIREEVRSHLLVLAAGHEELGCSPTEALQAAMAQFGDAKEIGRSLSREYPKPFALHALQLWKLLHVAIGGAVGALAFINMDCMFQRMHETTYINLTADCVLGMAFGWLPALQLFKRPASPLRAAARTGLCYTTLTTGLMTIIALLNGAHGFKQFTFLFMVIAMMGLQGALSGAAMSLLFRYLQRYAPQSKSLFARR